MKKVISFILSVLLICTVVPMNQAQAAAEPFKDIKSNNRFYEPIWSLTAKGVLVSEDDNSLKIAPNKLVTRADAADMITAMLGLELESDHPGFRDVTKENVHYDSMAALAERGIIAGFKDGTIKPNEVLTRAQMAKMISLSFKYKTNANAVIPFKDVAKGNWAVPYIDALVRSGVTTGTTATTFSPNGKLTRQQMALFLYRAHQKKPVSQYNDEEIFNLIREVQNKADMVMEYYMLASKKPAFSKVRAELLPYAETALVDSFMKEFYNEACINCDIIMYDEVYDTGLPYEIMERSNSQIKVKVRYPAEMNDAYTAVWTLVNVNGKWKIKDWEEYSIQEAPFKLTVKQAEHYLKSVIEDPWTWENKREYVKAIKHEGTSKGYYKFSIKTNLDDYIVEINPTDAALKE
ncbi:S-layer homology domain-containing protein [Bacillus sp. FJAT-42315]|uniref:S-layer homology domain-containing protein n=1 Tax=Bacillus sp. FJAT-42315 TaxID=2014077 RepID=UPI000C2356BC|nr:S-layer homology domain-containing protein [Bacillus sp. FJAT-42315]